MSDNEDDFEEIKKNFGHINEQKVAFDVLAQSFADLFTGLRKAGLTRADSASIIAALMNYNQEIDDGKDNG